MYYIHYIQKNRLIYIGEAGDLVKRLNQDYPTIREWNYFKYNVLPKQVSIHRKTFERMLIRNFASLFENKKGIKYITISDYKLTNDKIDK